MSANNLSLSAKVIVRDPKGRVLLLRRAATSEGNPGKWEFPGGKVGPGEAFTDALLREVKEETGLDVALDGSFGTCEAKLPGRRVVYLVLEAAALGTGVHCSQEHDESAWVAPADFDNVAFAPQFRRIARRYAQDVAIRPRVQPAKTEAREDDLFQGASLSPTSIKEHLRAFRDATQSLQDLKDKLEEYLRANIKAMYPMAQIEARIKDPESFAAKLIKKNKYDDPLHQVTDLVGARIIVHLQSEVDAVCRWIEEQFHSPTGNGLSAVIDRANSVDKRRELGADRFGYSSVHYVVELPVDNPPKAESSLPGLKAEIQVRTIAQHAWADIGHDRVYKSGCEIPDYWKREANRIAALLEAADEGFATLVRGLDAYKDLTSLCPDRKTASIQMGLWEAVREAGVAAAANAQAIEAPAIPEVASVALRVARLALELEDWPKAVAVTDATGDKVTSALLSAKGYALCKDAKNPYDDKWIRGINALTQASELSPDSLEPRLRLGELLTPHNREKALDHYRQAFELDPANPAALAGYVRCNVLEEKTHEFIPLLRPDIERAIGRSHDLVAAGADIPQALYRIAGFLLLLGPDRGSESLAMLARAVHHTRYQGVLVQALKDVSQLGRFMKARPDVECARRFLAAALIAKFPEAEWPGDTPKPAAVPLDSIGPVVIVAGGCDARFEQAMQSYRGLLGKAFEGFEGTIVSGGTIQGISGLVGELAQHSGGRIRAVGYLPRSLPTDNTANADPRYKELRLTEGERVFSAYEPIQNWLDLLAAGIHPSQVRLLGINGGNVAGLEYRLAVALGAMVGVIEGSGREAELVAKDWPAKPPERDDQQQVHRGTLLVLPPDPMTVRAFLALRESGPQGLSDDAIEDAARLVHQDFLEQKRYTHPDPVMQPWISLRTDFRVSNRSQIAYLTSILAAARFAVRPVKGTPKDPGFTDDEVKLMGEMEHGRWNVERLRDGWRYASKTDRGKKLSEYLVPWKALPPGIREYDFKNVRLWPEILAEVHYEIYRLPPKAPEAGEPESEVVVMKRGRTARGRGGERKRRE